MPTSILLIFQQRSLIHTAQQLRQFITRRERNGYLPLFYTIITKVTNRWIDVTQHLGLRGWATSIVWLYGSNMMRRCERVGWRRMRPVIAIVLCLGSACRRPSVRSRGAVTNVIPLRLLWRPTRCLSCSRRWLSPCGRILRCRLGVLFLYYRIVRVLRRAVISGIV